VRREGEGEGEVPRILPAHVILTIYIGIMINGPQEAVLSILGVVLVKMARRVYLWP